MTDGIAWLADRQSIAFGGYHVVFARGLSPQELAERLAATLRYEAEHVVVPVGEHTGDSLLELVEDAYDIGLRLGTVNDWVYAVAYGGWPAEFGPLTPVSRDGAHVFLLEYEEENGKPVPPQFVYVHDDRLVAAFNMHLDGSWGYKKVDGDNATAARLQERLTSAGLPHSEANHRGIHRAVLEVVGGVLRAVAAQGRGPQRDPARRAAGASVIQRMLGSRLANCRALGPILPHGHDGSWQCTAATTSSGRRSGYWPTGTST